MCHTKRVNVYPTWQATVRWVTLGTSGDDAVDRAMKEMQVKFRHIVLYKEDGETKFHVPDPDNISLDLNDDQQKAYAELVVKHGAHQEHAQEGPGQGGQGGQGRTTTGQEPTPNRNSPPEPTETSYLALSELSKEWDVVPSSAYEVRRCAVRCASLSAVFCAAALLLVTRLDRTSPGPHRRILQVFLALGRPQGPQRC